MDAVVCAIGNSPNPLIPRTTAGLEVGKHGNIVADEETGKIDFSHNPFSMPQGEMEALETKDPLDILAYQYDIVCNGVELSSGAIRNHLPEIMYKAFEIAGYSKEQLESRFGGMLSAFTFGAPPHGGSAPGIDRSSRQKSRCPCSARAHASA